MTRLAAALLAALNRHRKPDLPQRRAATARIPAAPDNKPGTDPASLWTCRRAWNASRKEGK